MTVLGIGMLGFGNVGRSFVDYLNRTASDPDREFRIRAVADRSGAIILENNEQLRNMLAYKQAGGTIAAFTGSAALDIDQFVRELPRAGVSVLVESLPTNLYTGEPALGLLKLALTSGASVVTVDKGPLVAGFDELQDAARTSHTRLAYSGTTGVRPPDEIAGHQVLEIRGVLNGTTNYVLTEMVERSLSFEKALADAQNAGIAEPDPSLDIDGWDTAAKILILAKSLMNTDSRIEEVARIGIGPATESLIQEARRSGRVVRLVGRARWWKGRVRLSVAPKIVDKSSHFYGIGGTSKAAVFYTVEGGEVIAKGISGRDAISQTILDDIMRITS